MSNSINLTVQVSYCKYTADAAVVLSLIYS